MQTGTLDVKVPSIIKFDILDLPRIRLKNKRNVIAVFTGDPGSGKSYSGLSMAEHLTPDFTCENVVFGFGEFMTRFKECSPGDFLIYEEAGAEFGARMAMTKENRNFSRILQVYRFKQVPTIFNLPNLNMLDVNGRRQMNYLIHTIRIDFKRKMGLARWYIIKPDDWADDVKRYKVRVYDQDSGERVRIDVVGFPTPSKRLSTEYEAKKREYFEDLYEDVMGSHEDKERKEAIADAKREKARQPVSVEEMPMARPTPPEQPVAEEKKKSVGGPPPIGRADSEVLGMLKKGK
jgi:hypothetical protein